MLQKLYFDSVALWPCSPVALRPCGGGNLTGPLQGAPAQKRRLGACSMGTASVDRQRSCFARLHVYHICLVVCLVSCSPVSISTFPASPQGPLDARKLANIGFVHKHSSPSRVQDFAKQRLRSRG